MGKNAKKRERRFLGVKGRASRKKGWGRVGGGDLRIREQVEQKGRRSARPLPVQ